MLPSQQFTFPSPTPSQTDENSNQTKAKPNPESASEILKKKREELLKAKKLDSEKKESKLEELKKKYQIKSDPKEDPPCSNPPPPPSSLPPPPPLSPSSSHPSSSSPLPSSVSPLQSFIPPPSSSIPSSITPPDNCSLPPPPSSSITLSSEAQKTSKLDELKKKYANQVQPPAGPVAKRFTEQKQLGKSTSTANVNKVNKFSFPTKEEKNEELPESKQDFLKKLEQMQLGLDKKLEKIKNEPPHNNNPEPLKINLNSYKAGLKKNVLSIDTNSGEARNIPKKIMTPSGMKIHSTLADRVAGLEAIFGPPSKESENNFSEKLTKEEKKLLIDDLILTHLNLERTEAPKKLHKKTGVMMRKRMSKEWN